MKLEELSHEELLSLSKGFEAKIVELEKAAEEQNAECEKHSATINEQADMIKEQAEQIDLLNGIIGSAKPAQTVVDTEGKKNVAPVIPAEPIEHNGKKYAWQRAAFRFPGDFKSISATEASVDKKILDRLLSIPGQKILKELE